MNLGSLEKLTDHSWRLPATGAMGVPGLIYGSEALVRAMDDKVATQMAQVAMLPGIKGASLAMPDAHWGYGFPIGGVAAFDPDEGGVISAGGVGFDISCGVRILTTDLEWDEVMAKQGPLADLLFALIPAGMGKRGRSSHVLDMADLEDMLAGGALWAVSHGYGQARDLERTEEGGSMGGADPDAVSQAAKRRQLDEVGTLGSGNHYLEVQVVTDLFDATVAEAFGLRLHQIVVSIHCGSRGLGHQVGVEFLRKMAAEAPDHGLVLPDRELAAVPIHSATGAAYLGAMDAAINCAFANRQVLTHLTRHAFHQIFPAADLSLLYDVSHNTCKKESHVVNGVRKNLYVHRKGATRALGPGHPALPEALRAVGQPVVIGGSMGTSSYILVGTAANEALAFGSSCHGAGRSLSRHEAMRRFSGRQILKGLADRGILVRSHSVRGVAEEAPEAYKDVTEVVASAEASGLSRRVARLLPVICIKG